MSALLRIFQTTAAREAYRFGANHVGRIVSDLQDGIRYLVCAEGLGSATGVLFPLDPSAMGGGSFDAAYYSGYHDDDMAWSSTSWADVHNVLDVLFDLEAVGISRSGSDWTVTDGGDYVFHAAIGNFKSGAGAALALKLSLDGVQKKQASTSRNNAGQLDNLVLHKYVASVPDGGVLTLEYQVTAAFGTYGQITLSDQDGRPANIEIYRVR